MKRRQADLAAGLLVGAVLLVGLLFTWDAYAQQRAFDGGTDGMMGGDGMMGSMMYTGPDPLWYLLGTLVLAGVLGGSYLLLRSAVEFDDDLAAPPAAPADELQGGKEATVQSASSTAEPTATDAGGEGATSTGASGSESTTTDAGEKETTATDVASEEESATGRNRPDILDVLPDDERRVLEPVVESPGLTQIALRDRSGFSKSKVSQTASELEKRGLIYREKQGRTYRIYPSDDLANR